MGSQPVKIEQSSPPIQPAPKKAPPSPEDLTRLQGSFEQARMNNAPKETQIREEKALRDAQIVYYEDKGVIPGTNTVLLGVIDKIQNHDPTVKEDPAYSYVTSQLQTTTIDDLKMQIAERNEAEEKALTLFRGAQAIINDNTGLFTPQLLKLMSNGKSPQEIYDRLLPKVTEIENERTERNAYRYALTRIKKIPQEEALALQENAEKSRANDQQALQEVQKEIEALDDASYAKTQEFVSRKEQETQVEVAARTLPSDHHPNHSEDKARVNAAKEYIAVFDGVGGRFGGQIAAEIARDTFSEVLDALPSHPTSQQVKHALRTGWKQATKKMMEVAEEKAKNKDDPNHEEYRNMATTATIAQRIQEDGKEKIIVAHAGDTRLYVVKKDGRIVQITKDDSNISPDAADAINNALSEDDLGEYADQWKKRNLIGNGILAWEDTEPAITEYIIENDDVALVATSDGTHDNLTERPKRNQKRKSLSDIARLFIQENKKVAEFVDDVVTEAQLVARDGSFRSKHDDITAAAMRLQQHSEY